MNDPVAMTWPEKAVAIVAVLVGIFLVLGGWGHLQAVGPGVWGAEDGVTSAGAIKLLPTAILLVGGLLNIALCKPLWDSRQWAYAVCIVITAAALVYLFYLLLSDLQDHPIPVFVGIVSAYLFSLIVTWGTRSRRHP